MKQCVVFGLGNPGNQFSYTRHNLGADMVLEWVEYIKEYAADVSDFKTHEKFHARSCEVHTSEATIIVLVPLVFMNESGKVISSYLQYHPIDREHILIVHDDIELSVGELKFQKDGSAHGHNGVRSIHEYLGDTTIPRLRIGIGRPHDATPVEKFVLATFTPEEKLILENKKTEIFEAITKIVVPSPVLGEG